MEQTELRSWLQNQIAAETGLPLQEVSCDEAFENFNLDSLSMVSITFELQSQVKTEISPTAFVEFNTINKLTEWISTQR